MRTTARRLGILLGATALSFALATPMASAETSTATHDDCCGLILDIDLDLTLDLHLGHHHHDWWCEWPLG
ncbi:hypothetical protein [Actinokineospora sp. HUAS TT18]|uniref:hypothetical protein n=1 Tax=Actinokineospora sp. HUAS TT18 TaxID=3447451 RepID=UPI003F524AA4